MACSWPFALPCATIPFGARTMVWFALLPQARRHAQVVLPCAAIICTTFDRMRSPPQRALQKPIVGLDKGEPYGEIWEAEGAAALQTPPRRDGRLAHKRANEQRSHKREQSIALDRATRGAAAAGSAGAGAGPVDRPRRCWRARPIAHRARRPAAARSRCARRRLHRSKRQRDRLPAAPRAGRPGTRRGRQPQHDRDLRLVQPPL